MKENYKKIAIFCDLTKKTGMGHVKRMLSLSFEFQKRNCKSYYFFDNKDKFYINNLSINLSPIFININEIKTKNIIKKFEDLNISIIVFDSYKYGYEIESKFRKKGFFVISIVDHVKKHSSNLIFSNRMNAHFISDSKTQWYMGAKYCLIKNKVNKKSKTHFLNDSLDSKKILLHAGAASLYHEIINFTINTIKYFKKNSIKISILCTNEKSKKIINKISLDLKCKSLIKIISYKRNLYNTLVKYDIVAGPSGITTFETILVGSLPFTFQLTDDGRDSLESWNSIGNLMHLTFAEKNNKKIVTSSWELISNKCSTLKTILKTNSNEIDGKGPERIAKIILSESKKKIKRYKNLKKQIINKNYETVKCNYYDMREFLKTRNSIKNRKVSTNPKDVINWPEHVKWWIDDRITKYKIITEYQIVAFHWLKPKKDLYGNFLTSGWFIKKNAKKKIKISLKIMESQLLIAKKNYKGFHWIIIIRNENKFIISFSLRIGFVKASKKTVERASIIFKIKSEDYKIMEMKL